ncbi:hypothetical protein OEZ85_013192 [Tetradesmus obliquus]|uniref:adenosine deaminase n=1 Tax=Tetradesmus obliquus TaxID=3088 RepID=A0ABY8U549_TETOB|nr:hypothetical protein OEZ85_013192 [Tetradesmus obliquus]
MDASFERIRNSRGALSVFFKTFPKGAELHYHYSGGIATELLIQQAVAGNLLLCPATSTVKPASPKPMDSCDWTPLQAYVSNGSFPAVRNQLLEEWSIYNYIPERRETRADHFFKTFGKFSAAKDVDVRKMLQWTKDNAVRQNIAYMEVMLTGPKGPRFDASLEAQLLAVQEARNATAAAHLLGEVFQTVDAATWKDITDKYVKNVELVGSGFDDANFTMRYLAYGTRVLPPLYVFGGLAVSFMASQASPLVVGVNLVGAETDVTALRDFWLHMQMVRYLRQKYPAVRVALHAGEMTPDLAEPQDLTHHVKDSVTVAMAHRIGHGEDLPFEDDVEGTLKFMLKHGVALEVLLTSNEFVLPQSEGDRHSFPLYFAAGVPMVLSSDDPGILRTSQTEQFMTLAYKYDNVRYADIKATVLNSIRYSFIKEPQLKARIYSKVQDDLAAFEAEWLSKGAPFYDMRKLLP